MCCVWWEISNLKCILIYFVIPNLSLIQGVSINSTFKVFRKGLVILSKRFLNYKLQPISTSILTHIAKKLQALQFSKYCLSEKVSSSKSFSLSFFFFDFPKTVLVFDLKFWASMSKSVRFMDKTLRIFLR